MSSGLSVQFLDQSLHRTIFDAMPMPVLVVDKDVSILEYNSAAAVLIGKNKKVVIGKNKKVVIGTKNGEALHCIHANEDPRGCGHSASCSTCVVRNSVRTAWEGGSVTRKAARLELLSGNKKSLLEVTISTRPFTCDKHSFVLLVLDDARLTKAKGRAAKRKRLA